MSQEMKNEMEEIDNVEVEALTEGELEEVAGGICSVSGCSNKQNWSRASPSRPQTTIDRPARPPGWASSPSITKAAQEGGARCRRFRFSCTTTIPGCA